MLVVTSQWELSSIFFKLVKVRDIVSLVISVGALKEIVLIIKKWMAPVTVSYTDIFYRQSRT